MEQTRRKLEHSIHLLPDFLREIAQLVGVDKAVLIARRLGGRRFYFPERLTHDNELVQLVGWRDAQRLCHRFAKNREIFPTARHYLRWFDARALRLQGLDFAEIAQLIGVVPRHAQELLDGFNPDEWYVDDALAARIRCSCCGGRIRAHGHSAPPPAEMPASPQLDFGFPAR